MVLIVRALAEGPKHPNVGVSKLQGLNKSAVYRALCGLLRLVDAEWTY